MLGSASTLELQQSVVLAVSFSYKSPLNPLYNQNGPHGTSMSEFGPKHKPPKSIPTANAKFGINVGITAISSISSFFFI
jgi:hypothetical protein